MLEQADRARRAAEQELQDCNETLSDLNAQNQSLLGAKRRVEAETETVKQELDEVGTESRMAEDKAHRTMLEAAKLADELRMEQDNTNRLESDRKVAEHQIHELQNRLDEAEANALKNGKKAAAKLEARLRELEGELDAEQRRLGDASKNVRKAERRIKELDFQYEEDRKQQEHMQDLVDKLQQKVIFSVLRLLSHCSKSRFFIQKFDFDEKHFEFLRQNFIDNLEFESLKMYEKINFS